MKYLMREDGAGPFPWTPERARKPNFYEIEIEPGEAYAEQPASEPDQDEDGNPTAYPVDPERAKAMREVDAMAEANKSFFLSVLHQGSSASAVAPEPAEPVRRRPGRPPKKG